MKEIIQKRTLQEAKHILATKDTVRKTAIVFAISKSTVHNDLKKRLKKIDIDLFNKINQILKNNNAIKHIRGGEATKIKYKRGYQ